MTNLPVHAPTVNPTPAEHARADYLAWLADSPDNDATNYPGPGWDLDDVPASPIALEDDYHETGYQIGRTGANPSFRSINVTDSPVARARGEAPFYWGLARGRQAHARGLGYDLGVAGQPADRPATVPAVFDRDFQAGWRLGADDWAERCAIQAEWAAEAAADEEDRWHGAELAEALGYVRAANLARAAALVA